MRATTRPLGSLGLAPFLLAFAACTAGGGDWDVLMPDLEGADVTRVSGTVIHLDLEGGVFVIRAEDGTSYDPTNLPEGYRIDGTPVEADVRARADVASIRMVGPVVDIVRLRRVGEAPVGSDVGAEAAGDSISPPATVTVEGTGVPASLAGSAWKLADLGGTPALADVDVTLRFGEDGTVAGRGSCNRYSGPVEVSGDSISFGALASTRMACPEAISRQEDRFFAALRDADQWEIIDSNLLIFGGSDPAPLRFEPATEE
ncbi:MAG: META domain-containing protein [Gemmatimonadales bacterium]|jgi:heat shock protein HslJ